MAGRNRVLVANLPVSTLRDELASAFVAEVSVRGSLSLCLGVVMRARAQRSGLFHVPTSAWIGGDESGVWLSHGA